MTQIGIGIIGGGYMGKAHAVAMAAVGAVFQTRLRPRLVSVAATSAARAEAHRAALGFDRAAADWQALIADPGVEAVVIASPQETHKAIALAAIAAGKPVFCEKPVGLSGAEASAIARAADAAGVVAMSGFNYIRTPASQFARGLVADGGLGRLTWFRAEHTEDFLSDPDEPASWRTEGAANGNLGDLAPHIINAALALMGPVASVMADVETVHTSRPGPAGPVAVTNDDQAQMLVRFRSGVMGHLYISRVATGRKMGYAYEIAGTRGAIRFDQEDQNAVHLYRAEGPVAERGFRKVLTGPDHPDYKPFCLGPGHGTGYQDQIIIEARDFLEAIADRRPRWPTLHDAAEVWAVIEAARLSAERRAWVDLPG
jgi:predicted dehydrogenase